jgi:hypothetical protein
LTKYEPEIPHDLGEPDEKNVTLEFQPNNSMLAILDRKFADEWPLISGWALSRLVAWAFFDQQESTRESGPAERPFEPNYAYKAGQLYLLYHIDSLWRDYEASTSLSKPPPERLWTAIHTFLQTGEKRDGFGLAGETLSALHNDARNRQSLKVVYDVMDFLIRAKLSGRRELCRINVALRFVLKSDLEREGPFGKSRIGKIWDHFRDVAPYIYGFYPSMYFLDGRADASSEWTIKTDADWISRIAQLAASASVEECLGHAAFAVDLLAGTDTHIVRIDDFDGVPRVTPLLRKFDADDENVIKSYDPKSPLRD